MSEGSTSAVSEGLDLCGVGRHVLTGQGVGRGRKPGGHIRERRFYFDAVPLSLVGLKAVGYRHRLREETSVGPTPTDRHVVLWALVPLLEHDQVLPRDGGAVVHVRETHRALCLQASRSAEVLCPLGLELLGAVAEEDVAEELREGVRLEGHRAVGFDAGTVSTEEAWEGHMTDPASRLGYGTDQA